MRAETRGILDDYVAMVVAQAPPFTAEQVCVIAASVDVGGATEAVVADAA